MLKLNEIKCFILDMDGTLYLGDGVINGAKEFLSLLDEQKISYYFYTNNSSKSPADYKQKLEKLGLGSHPVEKIITSGDVAADYIIRKHGTGARVCVEGTDSLMAQLRLAGISCVTSGEADCVLVGFDTTLNYEKVRTAAEYLRKGAPFLATNIDAVCPAEGGAQLPDCGSICAMLTHATGKEPKFLGKPSSEAAQYISRITGTPAEYSAVVGDRLYTDIRLAIDNGMCAIGVLSGETSREEMETSVLRPHYTFEGVYELYLALKALP